MKSSNKILLLAMLLFCFASIMYANPINCSATPSDSACAPTLTMTVQLGNGQTQTITSIGTPTFSSGSWNVNFGSESTAAFVFTGGQLVTNSDPFVGFSFGVINTLKTNETFSFDYQTPFSGGPYGYLQSVFGDVLIDSNFTGTSKVTPVGSLYIMNTYDTGNLLNQVGLGKGCTTVSFVCTSPDVGSIGPLLYNSFVTGTLEVKGSF